MYDPEWRTKAACRNHHELGPDAWFALKTSFPQGDGARAYLVCRNVCPLVVRESCRTDIQGEWLIAGNGWWDHKGRFQRPPREDLMDVHMTAAYLGVAPEDVRRWMSNGTSSKTRLIPILSKGGRAWFSEDQVKELAKLKGPGHGTSTMYYLHHYRGEMPCEKCRDVMSECGVTEGNRNGRARNRQLAA